MTDLTAAPAEVTVQQPITVGELTALIRNEDAFKKFFKKQAEGSVLAQANWQLDRKSFKCVLPDGSLIRLRFFNTVKEIMNSRLEPIAGRESWLSYFEVTVQPAGERGYTFLMDKAQHLWGFAKNKAEEAHLVSVQKLVEKAALFGIDLTQADAWSTHYVGKL